MATKNIGQRVKILAGEFVGKTGEIVNIEKRKRNESQYYRVKLDEPVKLPGINYIVRDDLWQGAFLRNCK
jgi:hypothetical protein